MIDKSYAPKINHNHWGENLMGEIKSSSSRNIVLYLLICAAVFLLIFFYIPGEGPSGLDRAVGDWIAGLKSEGWTSAMQAMAFLGGSVVIIVTTLLLTAVAAWFMGIRKALWIIAGVAITYVVNSLLKAWIARPRPETAWGIEADGFSFPSGNAMLAVALYGLFAIWMCHNSRIGKGIKTAIGWIAVLLILLIGWSRLYFSVHYVTDIVAGYAVAGSIVLLLLLVDRKFRGSR